MLRMKKRASRLVSLVSFVSDGSRGEGAFIGHVLEIAGVEHVGLGSDSGIETGLKGLEDVTKTPYITQGLPRRTYSDDDILLDTWRGLPESVQECSRLTFGMAKKSPSVIVNVRTI